MKSHRPIHIHRDDTVYFITSATVDKRRYFNDTSKKGILLNVMHKACDKFNVDMPAWAALDNHYHILVKIARGADVPRIINNININSARLLNVSEDSRGRKVWYQYFDRCIRDENDYWARFNYIHHNPVKHGYCGRMEDYCFSSYRRYMEEKGKEWLDDYFEKYPIIDFIDENDLE